MMTSKNFKRAAYIFEKCRQVQQSFLDKNDAEFLNNLLDLADCYLSMGMIKIRVYFPMLKYVDRKIRTRKQVIRK